MTLRKSKLVGPNSEALYVDDRGRFAPMSMRESYSNASRDRLRHGTRGAVGSNNAHHDSRTLEELIRDCTQLSRNDFLARALMNARTDHVVGSRIYAEARTDDDDWNDQAESMFAQWSESRCDITGQQSLTEMCMAIVNRWDDSGGILANKIVSQSGRRCSLEMIDVIRLKNPSGRQDTKYMHGGVEISESTNRPIAYHIADWNDQGTMLKSTPKRYDAGGIMLINNPRMQGVGQHRTAPRLASTIDRFETINTATKATWKAYVLQAFMALAITRDNAEGVSTEDELAQALVNVGVYNTVDEAKERGVWGPGTVMDLMPGESITAINPTHPTTGFDVMLWTELTAICAEQGLPLELVFMRFLKNYAASRSAIAVAWKKIQFDQQALIRRFLMPVYRWFIANEQLEGRLPRKDLSECFKAEFIMPSMPVLDPKAEAEGLMMELSSGLKLHETALRQIGSGDRKEFLRKYEIEQKENRKAGISYSRPKAEFSSETVNKDQTQDEIDEENANA